MKSKDKQLVTGRRDVLKKIGLGSVALLSGGFENISEAQALQQEKINKPSVGHSAQAHMDLACWNFVAQEGGGDFSDFLKEVFPGCCTKKGPYIYVNDSPGLGIDINEKLAAKYPIDNNMGNWTIRKRDGTIIRP
jgi:hypothetical protein